MKFEYFPVRFILLLFLLYVPVIGNDDDPPQLTSYTIQSNQNFTCKLRSKIK